MNENDTDAVIAHEDRVAAARDRANDRRDKADANAYRGLMASSDTSRYEEMAGQRETIGAALSREATAGAGAYSPGALGDAGKVLVAARDAYVAGQNGAAVAASSVKRTLDDQLANPAGKVAVAEELIESGRRELGKASADAMALADTAIALLTEDALPKVPAGQEMVAREDAKMLLGAAHSAVSAQAAAVRYVEQHDDSVAAMLADRHWLKMYVTGRGWSGTDVDRLYDAISSAAVRKAATSSDSRRKASALAIGHAQGIRRAAGSLPTLGATLDPRRSR
ncbi:hypothetical protein GCM10023201_50410 [Actinomycetospora corticicola]|uniref:Uncharacterized protein n=1 Tax=Actinomycetospora corticicola TaxID=663602 RepID=A0A7Y9DY41_9PSEU|nr:hypothetical protein [Actinomycetospora corticicola]NYD37693.1 hypothetical protein [Actinomycetospora corticicola]